MSGERRPILLLVNPVSGGKPTAPGGAVERPEPEELRDALTRHDLSVELRLLEEGDDVGAIASAAVEAGQDVVAAGGDGTVRPAASALVGTDGTLGIVPFGSWNNIARGCGIPDEPTAAIDVVGAGNSRLIDVGLAWHPTGVDGPSPTEAPPDDATRFFEAAGIGLDAAAFGAAQVGERRGIFSALRSAWRALRKRRTAMLLTVDGHRYRTAAPAVTICNGPYHGMGFALAPEADPSDGMLDVVVFSGMTRFDVLRHFLAVARGRARHEPRVNRVTARHIQVAGVRRTLPVHADGESIGTTPVAFAVLPGGLRIFGSAP
ncbi:MAG TPA: diacylglycerol kinase family protein [Candidatus Limnocylindria bacterium]|nr:diacylglycerol kinase family protein [Candidatus Limnocylindria bacterium]